jgi:threonine/homoserine/homoserine lactone efflux protein
LIVNFVTAMARAMRQGRGRARTRWFGEGAEIMREVLAHQITVEDTILGLSLFFNFIVFLGVLVLVDVRFANWRRRRDWESSQKRKTESAQEDVRNPIYGMKPRE